MSAPLLNGKAKAMVVVGSRVEAVRWRLAIDAYIKAQGYKIGTLVAFSGEVNDSQSGADPFSETSKTMNPNLKGQGIREAFDTRRLSNPAGCQQVSNRIRSTPVVRDVC